MELYSKEELLKELKKEYSCGGECGHCPEVLDAGSCSVLRCIRRIIDNTQPVEIATNLQPNCNNLQQRPQGEQIAWEQGYECGKNERPQGEWIDEGQYAEGHSEHAYICKKCGYQIIELPNMIFENRFCKYCGADMRKGGVE